MGLASFSLKHTAMPSLVAIRIFSFPVVGMTVISSSPSSRFSARMPLERMFFKAALLMRFTVPFFVTKTRN